MDWDYIQENLGKWGPVLAGALFGAGGWRRRPDGLAAAAERCKRWGACVHCLGAHFFAVMPGVLVHWRLLEGHAVPVACRNCCRCCLAAAAAASPVLTTAGSPPATLGCSAGWWCWADALVYQQAVLGVAYPWKYYWPGIGAHA